MFCLVIEQHKWMCEKLCELQKSFGDISGSIEEGIATKNDNWIHLATN